MLSEIAVIRKHQALLSADLKNLQSSNAHLWQEAIASRDRNKRCQETINKILGFLAQVFGGRVLNPHSQSRPKPSPRSPQSDFDTDTGVPEEGDDADDVLVHEGSDSGSADQSSKVESMEHSAEVRYSPASPATAHVYNMARLPRLMLEDVDRHKCSSEDGQQSMHRHNVL